MVWKPFNLTSFIWQLKRIQTKLISPAGEYTDIQNIPEYMDHFRGILSAHD